MDRKTVKQIEKIQFSAISVRFSAISAIGLKMSALVVEKYPTVTDFHHVAVIKILNDF